MDQTKIKVAIIGGGPAGLAQLFALRPNLDQIEPTIFEKQDDVGGLWNHQWRTGVDQYGEQLHNAMYRQLTINFAREITNEYSDWPFAEAFADLDETYPHQYDSSYVRREVMIHYIKARLEKKYPDMKKFLRLTTAVKYVRQVSEDKYEVISRHLPTMTETTEVFDYVILAAGHHNTPHMPEYPGLQNCQRIKVLHSKDWKCPYESTGKNVFLLGGSYSAEDLAPCVDMARARVISFALVVVRGHLVPWGFVCLLLDSLAV